MNIVIRNDPNTAPNRLWSIVQHLPAVKQCSLAAADPRVPGGGGTGWRCQKPRLFALSSESAT